MKFEIYGRLDFGIRSTEVLRLSADWAPVIVFGWQKVASLIRSTEFESAVDRIIQFQRGSCPFMVYSVLNNLACFIMLMSIDFDL